MCTVLSVRDKMTHGKARFPNVHDIENCTMSVTTGQCASSMEVEEIWMVVVIEPIKILLKLTANVRKVFPQDFKATTPRVNA